METDDDLHAALHAQLENGGPKLAGLDALALWRHVPPLEAADADIRRVQAALVLAADEVAEKDRGSMFVEALRRADIREPRAWRHLSIMLPELLRSRDGWRPRPQTSFENTDALVHRLHDLSASCLWLAVTCGDGWSTIALVNRLSRCPPELVREGQLQDVARALPHHADFKSSVAILGLGSDVRDYAVEKLKLQPPEEHGATVAELPVRTVGGRPLRPGKPSGPVLTVAPGVIGAAHGVLGKPLPLKSWPPADTMEAKLGKEFPWAGEAIQAVVRHLRMAERVAGPCYRMPPLVVVGRPGTGKSRFLASVAELCLVHGGLGNGRLNGAGMSDNRTLAGTPKGWSSASPCFATLTILSTGVANPVIVMDELDKLDGTDGRNGNPATTLMALTDPTIAAAHYDEGLAAHCDLSKVSWLFTANDRSKIDPILRARLRFVELPAPRPIDFDVLMDGILGDISVEFGGDAEALPELDEVVLTELRRGFRSGNLSARGLSRLVRKALDGALAVETSHTLH